MDKIFSVEVKGNPLPGQKWRECNNFPKKIPNIYSNLLWECPQNQNFSIAVDLAGLEDQTIIKNIHNGMTTQKLTYNGASYVDGIRGYYIGGSNPKGIPYTVSVYGISTSSTSSASGWTLGQEYAKLNNPGTLTVEPDDPDLKIAYPHTNVTINTNGDATGVLFFKDGVQVYNPHNPSNPLLFSGKVRLEAGTYSFVLFFATISLDPKTSVCIYYNKKK
jgi:hypothetical protein